ncbi:MAG: shikimate kinase [Mongoliitalea sp.]
MNRPILKIVLVGLPGSGKSTFGRKLAKDLNFAFIDLDEYLETKEGKTIPSIFYEQGEGAFRKLETQYLNEILDQIEGFVLSTGGGTPCFNDNMELINTKAISIFLDIPIDIIHKRLLHSEGNRPLFNGLDSTELKTKLEDLAHIRTPYYNQSKIKFSGEEISTELVVSELLEFFKS